MVCLDESLVVGVFNRAAVERRSTAAGYNVINPFHHPRPEGRGIQVGVILERPLSILALKGKVFGRESINRCLTVMQQLNSEVYRNPHWADVCGFKHNSAPTAHPVKSRASGKPRSCEEISKKLTMRLAVGIIVYLYLMILPIRTLVKIILKLYASAGPYPPVVVVLFLLYIAD